VQSITNGVKINLKKILHEKQGVNTPTGNDFYIGPAHPSKRKQPKKLKTPLYILAMLASSFCVAQDFKKCIVYQFAGKDSSKKHVSLVQNFNKQGQLVSETFSNHKKSAAQGTDDGTCRYYYNNSILAKQLFIDEWKDTTKVLYYYNDKKQCTKEKHFSCERRLKKNSNKGLGQPGGCVVLDKDLDTNRTWMEENVVFFLYDDKGRKTNRIDNRDYNRTWLYDEKDSVIQEKGFSSNTPAYVREYQYHQGYYKYSTFYYNENEKPTSYVIALRPNYISTIYLDKKNRIVKAETRTGKNTKASCELTEYDAKGRVAKTVFLDAMDQPEITHIFEYK
jgi:hypothetical protein